MSTTGLRLPRFSHFCHQPDRCARCKQTICIVPEGMANTLVAFESSHICIEFSCYRVINVTHSRANASTTTKHLCQFDIPRYTYCGSDTIDNVTDCMYTRMYTENAAYMKDRQDIMICTMIHRPWTAVSGGHFL